MAKTVKETTKAPTGLGITRSGVTFTFSWKIGDKDYADGQYFQYMIDDTGTDKWLPTKNYGIGKKATSKSLKINKASFFPYKNKGKFKPYLYKIGMRVKGNRDTYKTKKKGKTTIHKPGPSAWSTKYFNISVPNTPSVSAALSSEQSNVCTFSWAVTVADDDIKIFTDVEWQSIRVKNSTQTNGSKLSWKGASTGTSSSASGSHTFAEDTNVLYKNGDSYARWFRVRSRGPRGVSPWVYASHVYAIPNRAQVRSVSAYPHGSGGYRVTITWDAPANRKNPNDRTTVQYSVATPNAGLTCPSGASWTDVDTVRDTADNDASVFDTDGSLGKDECLFVRVNTYHDGKTNYGVPQVAYKGSLKDPSDLSVETDNVTHKATITATNSSDISDSVLVARYVPAKGDAINCGIIPHNSSSVMVQCPNWSDQTSFAFEVYAMVGSYSKQTRTDQVDAYTVNPKMKSSVTLKEGGSVPAAPTNVIVTRVEGKPDTVQVTWDWPWQQAGSAEISWSDHDDAWESTDEPDSYTISNLHASKWNISGLETGKTWYIRVRLIKGNLSDSSSITYGPWSAIELGTIDLSSAPNRPVLVVSPAIIAENDTTTASWVYTTTDNTPQAYAEVVVVYQAYIKTIDTSILLGKEYYTVTATLVQDPVEGMLKFYYELSSGVYVKTTDTEIASGKDYYTLTGLRVDDPVSESLSSYYEANDAYDFKVAHSLTAQHVSIDSKVAGFSTGNVYKLACRVKSASGQLSEWSDSVSIAIAEPLVCTISETSLVQQSETKTYTDPVSGEEVTYTRTFLSLTEMPLTLSVSGAGEEGRTTVVVERAEDYHLDRPDESEFHGYKHEVVLQKSIGAEGQFLFDIGDLIGLLDDGAKYNIIATIQDGLGQKDEAVVPFEVHWEHQATEPGVVIEVDETNMIVKITPTADDSVLYHYELTEDTAIVASKTYYTRSGSGTEQDPYVYTAVENPTVEALPTYYEKISYGDVADIYRLSIDKPELIVRGATFGETYVDPYPALGEMGGHRVVFRTQNGDYITSDNTIAKVDSTDLEESDYIDNEQGLNVIDFDGIQIQFYYDTDYSSSWDKDFQETQYLGGSIQGDWNPAVSRSGTLSTQAITVLDQDMLQSVRRLAAYSGICHVRTADGSSYAADVQVSEDRVHDDLEMLVNYSLSITRVDSQQFDGLTLDAWVEEHPEEPEQEEENDELEQGV